MDIKGLNPQQRAQNYGMPTAKKAAEQQSAQGTGRANQDTYVPSVAAYSISQDTQVSTTSATTEDYRNSLLEKYDGMIEYNITVSDELLQKAMNDPKIAGYLESFIEDEIASHENYKGSWQLVHTETHIEDISSTGSVELDSLHVMASDKEYQDKFQDKIEMDNFTADIERLMLDNSSSLTETEKSALESVLSVFDSVYNGENPVTGMPNFLNKALMSPEYVTSGLANYNQGIMDDVSELKDQLTALLSDDSVELSDEVRATLEEALGKAEDILAGDNPLYDVATGDLRVNFRDPADKEKYLNGLPDLADSLFFGTDSEESFESFKEYMMKSNSNLLELMSQKDEEVKEDDILAEFYERIKEAAEKRAEDLEEEADAEDTEEVANISL